MGSVISAIATAVPAYRFSQKEILNFMINAHGLNEIQSGRLKKLYEVSGIEFRHSVIPDFTKAAGEYHFFGNEDRLEPFPGTAERSKVYEAKAKRLAVKVVEDLLSKGGIHRNAITHLITVSCTGMYAPGLDVDVIGILDLPKTIERTAINFMGCYGAFNALKAADYICRAEESAKVLIVDLELCTLHFQRENTLENWVANSLFSDGAAALLIESGIEFKRVGFKLKTFFNTLVTEAKDEMAWRIGDTGFQMHLSSHIAKNIGKKIKNVTADLLEKAKIAREDITQFAVHPGGRRILEVCEDVLDLPEEALQYSYDVLKQFGNMSSVSILFILEKLMAKAKPGENVMSFAFGPGLTFESMILEKTDARF